MSNPVTSAEEGAKEQTFQDDEATRAMLADPERELGVTGAGAVFRKALAIAKEASRAGEYSGFSGAGLRAVIGCPADIDLVKRWCEEASTIPHLKDRIKSAEARATTAESEVARLTADVARVEAERDEEKDRADVLSLIYNKANENWHAAESSASALRERVASLEAALRPFAEEADSLEAGDCGHLWESPQAMNLTTDHLRAARAALKGDTDA